MAVCQNRLILSAIGEFELNRVNGIQELRLIILFVAILLAYQKPGI